MKKFEIIALDAWGNSRDGFEVNQGLRTGKFVDEEQTKTPRRLFRALRTLGFNIPKGCQVFDWWEASVEIQLRTGQPWLTLELVRN